MKKILQNVHRSHAEMVEFAVNLYPGLLPVSVLLGKTNRVQMMMDCLVI